MKLKLIIEEHFGGSINYNNNGMRHRDEEETYYLDKGDKVYVEYKDKRMYNKNSTIIVKKSKSKKESPNA